jgi:hypothetical protein
VRAILKHVVTESLKSAVCAATLLTLLCMVIYKLLPPVE